LKPLEAMSIFSADPVPRLPRPFRVPSTSDEETWIPDPNALPSRETDGPSAGNPAGSHPERSELAIHPGSGSERKNWPESRWAELIRRVSDETGLKLLLVGGEAEGGKLERLASHFRRDGLEIAGSLPLTALANRLSRCPAFMGHDSGISHLAAAVGLPCLLLWGETDEATWRPLGTSVRILRHERGLDGIKVETVWRRMISGQ
jgi:ADP-heptose:LPS heptosyltransferase